MRIGLVTTTINVPKVLALYRKLGPDVRFFVAVDKKTPDEAMNFCFDDNAIQVCQGDQFKCSELIGWNCVERRNIALLEAVKWGADAIVTIDDDNASFGEDYFENFERMFGVPYFRLNNTARPRRDDFSGLEAFSPSGWFDPGDLLVPKTKHRGFPINVKSEAIYEVVTDARIGVAQGLCLGDPDIDAATRIVLAPNIHSVSELGRAGIVTDPRKTWTVFNTQNTAFIRELAPAMFQPPGVGRYSDIYASLICQRVMRERDLHIHFGQPFVWQQRNKHNLISDLRQEIDGMEHVKHLAGILEDIRFFADENPVRTVYRHLGERVSWWPKQASEAALAFIDDIESVM